MAEPISIQQLKDASLDVKSLEEVVNGDENVVVTTRLGETYPSVKGSIKTLFENGGLPATPFATKALMTASALVDGKYAMVTDGGVDNGLYVKTAGAWVKSAYDSATASAAYTDAQISALETTVNEGLTSNLAESKTYTDEKAGRALTVSDNLNNLNSGEYYANLTVLNSIVDGGLLQSLNYPSELTRSSAVRITVVVAPPSNYSVQSLEHIASGVKYTRNGNIGGSYQNWITQAVYNYGSLVITDELSDFVRAGQWGIPQTVIDANSPNGLLGYPTGLESSPANFTVSNTSADRTIQIITTKSAVYRRVLKTSNKIVQESWGTVDGGINTTNTYTTIAEGMAATKHDGDLFWVYPNTGNTLKQLTLFKRLTAQTQAIVFEQSTINEYLIAQGANWEIK